MRTGVADGNGWLAGLAMRAVHSFSQPLEKGIRPILRLAADPALRGTSGQYYRKFEQMPEDQTCSNTGTARRLWEISQMMTGLC